MSHQNINFSVGQARRILTGLFTHRPWIYWVDFLVSLTIGYGCGHLYLTAPWFSIQQGVALVVASFALFRVGSFIHEIVHFGKGEMRAFRVAWDILAGVPMLMPSFFYGNHIDHHNTHHYGTGQDGEYLPLGSGTLAHIAAFYAQVIFLPVVVVVRFLIITPLSLVSPRVRRWALMSQSSYVINMKYQRRSVPADAPHAYWIFIEVLCFLRTALIFVAPVVGWTDWTRIPQLYLIAVCVLGLNYIRNVVAHLYQGHGEPMSHAEQLTDSVNIEGGKFLGGPITELFFPLGLRFHALHHLFPALPYHNLPAAHRRLMTELPAESAYRGTVYRSFWHALSVLWGQTRQARALQREKTPTGADKWFDARRRLIEARTAAAVPPLPKTARDVRMASSEVAEQPDDPTVTADAPGELIETS